MSNRRNNRKASNGKGEKRRVDAALPCPACGKLSYRSKKIAAAAMASAIRRLDQPRDWWNYYRCPSGNGKWHIGKTPGVKAELGEEPRRKPRNERLSKRVPRTTHNPPR